MHPAFYKLICKRASCRNSAGHFKTRDRSRAIQSKAGIMTVKEANLTFDCKIRPTLQAVTLEYSNFSGSEKKIKTEKKLHHNIFKMM